MLSLDELIVSMKEGDVAMAHLGDEKWMVIKSSGCIRYFEDKDVWDLVPLSYSNLQAKYEII